MSFAEERLDLGLDYGTVGGPRFNTTVVVDGDGSEQRNINWTQPLCRWQLGDRTLDKSDLDYLRAFHQSRKGSEQGFRFRDWADYKVVNQEVARISSSALETLQLFKRYTLPGYNPFSWFQKTCTRTITKPVPGTLQLTINNAPLTGWTVDTSTGLVTLESPILPPGLGEPVKIIRASFEFDVPVRFEQDELSARFETIDDEGGIFTLGTLSLTEIRVPVGRQRPFDPLPTLTNGGIRKLSETIDLGYDYDTSGGARYNTAITAAASGDEQRIAEWQQPRRRWNLGGRDLDGSLQNGEGVDYWISLFRVCRGQAISFRYKDWQQSGAEVEVRFESDALDLRFESMDQSTGEVIFNLAGLPIVEVLPFRPVGNQVFEGGCNPVLYKVWGQGANGLESVAFEEVGPILAIKSAYRDPLNESIFDDQYIVLFTENKTVIRYQGPTPLLYYSDSFRVERADGQPEVCP